MIETKDLPIRQEEKSYIFKYAEPAAYANTQMSVYWTADEINVEKDVQDLRVNMTPAEKHGVITVLKLFTLYELLVGGEYWNGRYKEAFPRPEFELLGSTLGFVELGIHAQFYNKLNEAMMLNNREFYESYEHDPILKSRIDFVNASAEDEDLLYSLAVFALLEGAVLYSSFAFLKSFQSQGKNLLNNVCRGINFSVRDENLHSEAGSWTFKKVLEEAIYSEQEYKDLIQRIDKAADHIFDHESRIIDMIFEEGEIPGLDKKSMRTFVKSRINLIFSNLDLKDKYVIEENPIESWFYSGINATQFGDFFVGVQSEYNRNWDFEGTDF